MSSGIAVRRWVALLFCALYAASAVALWLLYGAGDAPPLEVPWNGDVVARVPMTFYGGLMAGVSLAASVALWRAFRRSEDSNA